MDDSWPNRSKQIPVFDTLIEVLLPTVCLGCERACPVSPLGLCSRCRSALEPIAGPRCATCLSTTIAWDSRQSIATWRGSPGEPRGDLAQCLDCLGQRRPYLQILCLYEYQPPFDRVIHGFKFGRLRFLGEVLATEAWDRYAEQLREIDLVVPVPLPWLRALNRGFNQSAVLAQTIALLLGRPMIEPLERRLGPAQSTIDTETQRWRNARRSIREKSRWRVPRLTLRGKNILLVDDVVTSGATLTTASRCLKRMGAGSVTAMAMGRRP